MENMDDEGRTPPLKGLEPMDPERMDAISVQVADDINALWEPYGAAGWTGAEFDEAVIRYAERVQALRRQRERGDRRD